MRIIFYIIYKFIFPDSVFKRLGIIFPRIPQKQDNEKLIKNAH